MLALLGRLATLLCLFGALTPSRLTAQGRDSSAVPRIDSLWYHASDVARLARTGRPQLLEFFHPN